MKCKADKLNIKRALLCELYAIDATLCLLTVINLARGNIVNQLILLNIKRPCIIFINYLKSFVPIL